jgi:hypothetical protein
MARSTFGMRGGLASHVRPIEYLGFGLVANRFDVVPVRTNHKRRIVVRVVARAQTRRTIVFAARLQSPAIESFDERRGRNSTPFVYILYQETRTLYKGFRLRPI